METVIFRDQQGEEFEVEPSNFDVAFERGLRPRDEKEMGIWESFKTGLGRGVQPALELMSGMTGFPAGQEQVNVEQELERSQAYAEHPAAYSVGAALPTVGTAVAGALGMRKGAQVAAPTVSKAATVVKPSLIAAKEAGIGALRDPNMISVARPFVAAKEAITEAVRQVPVTRGTIKEMEAIKRGEFPSQQPLFEKPKAAPEAGAVQPRPQPGPLGLYLAEAGPAPQKLALAEKAVTMAPSRLQYSPLVKALEMGTEARQKALAFVPREEAIALKQEAKQVFSVLSKQKQEEYLKLHNEAAPKYRYEMGAHIPGVLAKQIEQANATEGVSGAAKSALATASQVLQEGPSLYKLRPGPWKDQPPSEATPEIVTEWGIPAEPKAPTIPKDMEIEQFERLKVARDILRKQLDQIKRSKDPNVNTLPSITVLSNAKNAVDEVMKSIPEQKMADEIYAAGSAVRDAFSERLEKGKGSKKQVSLGKIERILGGSAEAAEAEDAIKTIDAYLGKFGDRMTPEQKNVMQAFVDRLKSARETAAEQRMLKGLQWQQGPTSPAANRAEAIARKEGLMPGFFRDPMQQINALDTFIGEQLPRVFGQGKSWSALSESDKMKVIEAFNWSQENRDATMYQKEEKFRSIFSKKGK